MDFHLTIDFFDDMYRAERDWDEAALRSLVRLAAEHRITALHWIGHGRFDEGMWDAGSYLDWRGQAQRLREKLPHPRQVLVDEAHRHGLKVWDVLKPCDLVFGLPYASTPLGQGRRPPVGLPQVGAEGTAAIGWLRQHPEYRMRLHPALDVQPGEETAKVKTIRLWHEGPELGEPPAVEIFTSTDNGTYAPLGRSVPVRRGRARRAQTSYGVGGARESGASCECAFLEIGPLDLAAPFIALRWPGRFGLANSLHAMAELLDANGRQLAFTWGLAPVQPWGERGHDWRQVGIAYDTARSTGLPRGQLASLLRNRVALDDMPCVGFARGRNRYLVAPLEAAVPGVGEALLGMVDDALADGVDGVDFRLSSHTETLDAENYGFNPETCRLYEEEYGKSPLGAGFDLEAWQRLRGRTLGRLLENLSRRVRGGGAAAALHVQPQYETASSDPCHQGLFWDWRTWLKNGWFDSVTAKQFRVENPVTAELIALAANCGLPVVTNQKPSLGSPAAECDASWCNLIDQAAAHGFTSFNLYECANLVRLQADGTLKQNHPRAWDKVAGRK